MFYNYFRDESPNQTNDSQSHQVKSHLFSLWDLDFISIKCKESQYISFTWYKCL